MSPMADTNVDVLIVGAGLAGIGAACHLRRAFPHRSYAVLESRDAIGGTWDLFRYPGVRSDSDMYTLGYRFRPWTGEQAIASGEVVLEYLRETALEYGVDEHIRYHHRVTRADWSSAEARWTVTVQRRDTGTSEILTCRFLFLCTGYFRYDKGYTPDFPGVSDFAGEIVHPQHWPSDLVHTGKRVLVIGSGATAVTLIPALARSAGHVTMLQRSPSYIISLPGRDPTAALLREWLPERLAAKLNRARYVARQVGFYEYCRRRPHQARALLRKLVERQLPDEVEFDQHFRPRYLPWDQRLCVAPSGDLFKALRSPTVDVVTDTIDRFTEEGIQLASGRVLEADIVVTATGLSLLPLGGTLISVDGVEVKLPETMAYRGMMLSGVPNLAFVIGYTNASWTLKVDLVCEYVVRLLEHMENGDFEVCEPQRDPGVAERPFLDFRPNYVLRSIDQFPRQGTVSPWRLRSNYLLDRISFRRSRLDDGSLRFS